MLVDQKKYVIINFFVGKQNNSSWKNVIQGQVQIEWNMNSSWNIFKIYNLTIFSSK